MTIEIIKIVSPYLLSLLGVLFSMAGYIMKRLNDRIQELEKDRITREQARQLVDDRVKHIEDKLDDISQDVRRIIDKLIG